MTPHTPPTPPVTKYEAPMRDRFARQIYIALDRHEREVPEAWMIEAMKGTPKG